MSDAKIDLDELHRIARLSRRGSRRAVLTPEGWNVMTGGQFIADCRDLSSTAALIALTDPSTILVLVEAVRAAQAVDATKDGVDYPLILLLDDLHAALAPFSEESP